jgi:hypothetical protein
MMPTVFDKRPPFVRFEEREMGLDPEATEKAQRPIPRVVILALITPHGSKDCVEKIASDWLKQIKALALQGTYPLEWSQFFHAQYEEWLKGNELPREGTPVKTWAMATREQITRLLAVGMTTVEDLGQLPDSGLSTIGLDGRYLRDLARGWLNEAKDKGANAKALADANVRISTLEADKASLADRVSRLERALVDGKVEGSAAATAEAQPPRRKRPQAEEAA